MFKSIVKFFRREDTPTEEEIPYVDEPKEVEDPKEEHRIKSKKPKEVKEPPFITWTKKILESRVDEMEEVFYFTREVGGEVGNISASKVMDYKLKRRILDIVFEVSVKYAPNTPPEEFYQFYFNYTKVDRDTFIQTLEKYESGKLPKDYETNLKSLEDKLMYNPPFPRPEWLKSFEVDSSLEKRTASLKMTRTTIFTRGELKIEHSYYSTKLTKGGKITSSLEFFEELEMMNLKP